MVFHRQYFIELLRASSNRSNPIFLYQVNGVTTQAARWFSLFVLVRVSTGEGAVSPRNSGLVGQWRHYNFYCALKNFECIYKWKELVWGQSRLFQELVKASFEALRMAWMTLCMAGRIQELIVGQGTLKVPPIFQNPMTRTPRWGHLRVVGVGHAELGMWNPWDGLKPEHSGS